MADALSRSRGVKARVEGLWACVAARDENGGLGWCACVCVRSGGNSFAAQSCYAESRPMSVSLLPPICIDPYGE